MADPAWSDVKSLNHWDGADGATASPDQVAGVSWTFFDDARLEDSRGVFGSSAALECGGTNATGRVVGTGIPNFGTGDFAIQFTLQGSANASARVLLDQRPSSTNGNYLLVYVDASNKLGVYVNSTQLYTSGGNIFTGSVRQIGIKRIGGTAEVWIDNSQDGAGFALAASLSVGAGGTFVGGSAFNPGTQAMAAWLDEFRIVTGASADIDFSVPQSAPWPDGPTGPALTSPAAVATGTTTADFEFDTDTGEGDAWVIGSVNNSEPDETQIKAGQDGTGASAAYSDTAAVTATGTQIFNATGLSPDTEYFFFAYQEDDSANGSNFVTDSATTDAPLSDIAYNLFFENHLTPIKVRGKVVLSRALDAGQHLEILRKTPIENPFLAMARRPFNSEAFEYALDKICFIQQEIEGHACACPEYPEWPEGPPPTVPVDPDPPPECKPYACDAYDAAMIEGAGAYWPLTDPTYGPIPQEFLKFGGGNYELIPQPDVSGQGWDGWLEDWSISTESDIDPCNPSAKGIRFTNPGAGFQYNRLQVSPHRAYNQGAEGGVSIVVVGDPTGGDTGLYLGGSHQSLWRLEKTISHLTQTLEPDSSSRHFRLKVTKPTVGGQQVYRIMFGFNNGGPPIDGGLQQIHFDVPGDYFDDGKAHLISAQVLNLENSGHLYRIPKGAYSNYPWRYDYMPTVRLALDSEDWVIEDQLTIFAAQSFSAEENNIGGGAPEWVDSTEMEWFFNHFEGRAFGLNLQSDPQLDDVRLAYYAFLRNRASYEMPGYCNKLIPYDGDEI